MLSRNMGQNPTWGRPAL